MQTIISALHFPWLSMAECLETAACELQLDGVEFSWHANYSRPHCTREDLEALAALRGRHAMHLSAHLWEDLAALDTVPAADSLLHWLGLCGATGVTDFVIHGGAFANQGEGIARVRRVFEGVLPAFEKAGVVLNLENHYPFTYRDCHELFSTPEEFLQVLNLNSPSLQFCFDTGHGNMSRNTPALLETLAPWLNYVHLADNMGIDDNHLAYAQGTVDWAGIFSRLVTSGYHQRLCIEYPVREDRAPFHACVAEIQRLWPVGR